MNKYEINNYEINKSGLSKKSTFKNKNIVTTEYNENECGSFSELA